MLLTLLGAIGGVTRAQDPLRGWHEGAGVAEMHLSSVEVAPSRVGLVFTNVGGQLITAFCISLGRGASYTVDYFDSGSSGLAAGSSYTLWIPIQPGAQPAGRTAEASAVVFDDGTGDGMEKEIACIRVNRLGRMAEGLRIASILERGPASYVGDEGVTKLRQVIGALPESPAEALQSLEGVSLPGVRLSDLRLAGKDVLPDFLAGVRNTRWQMLGKIQGLAGLPITSPDKGAATQGRALAELQQTCRAKAAAYREFCARHQMGADH